MGENLFPLHGPPRRGRRTEKACGLCRRPRIRWQHLDALPGRDVWRGYQWSGVGFNSFPIELAFEKRASWMQTQT